MKETETRRPALAPPLDTARKWCRGGQLSAGTDHAGLAQREFPRETWIHRSGSYKPHRGLGFGFWCEILCYLKYSVSDRGPIQSIEGPWLSFDRVPQSEGQITLRRDRTSREQVGRRHRGVELSSSETFCFLISRAAAETSR